jgi:hypothetical protein
MLEWRISGVVNAYVRDAFREPDAKTNDRHRNTRYLDDGGLLREDEE